MAKWKIVTQGNKVDSDGRLEQFEEVIVADQVMLDQTGKFLVVAKVLESKVLPDARGNQPAQIVKIIKFINAQYVIEAYDINENSHTLAMVSN